MTAPAAARAGAASASAKIVRHALVDRLFHWITAACVLTLLATAFLPIVGVEFGWVTVHWITGVVLIVAVLFHVVRGLFWQSLRTVWIGAADVRDALAIVRSTLRIGRTAPAKPGKYSFAQKLIHAAFAVVVLTVSVTGAFMLARVNTPWWKSNPYLLADKTWGVVYVLHDLAALSLDHDGDDARLLRAASREAVVHACDDPWLDHARRIWRAS